MRGFKPIAFGLVRNNHQCRTGLEILGASRKRKTFVEFRIDRYGGSNFGKASAGDQCQIGADVATDNDDFSRVDPRARFEPIESRIEIYWKFVQVGSPFRSGLNSQAVLFTAFAVAADIQRHDSPAPIQQLF